MAVGGVIRPGRIGGWLLLIVAVALMVLAFRAWEVFYDRHGPELSVDRESDGRVVTKVIDSTLGEMGDLRVTRLTGTVQATASDSQMWGWLPATYVMKAPFSVSYFVDLRKLDRSKFFWDEKGRVLTVLVPDAVPEPANVDQSRIMFERTDGVFVGRAAMDRLRRRASGKALAAAQAEALKPANLLRAREHGRRIIARLYGQPLRIAGIDATVRVRYEGEPVRDGEQWDRSRSLAEIFAAR